MGKGAESACQHLADALASALARGHEWVQLVHFRRGGNSPKNWDRCLVVRGKPSLYGRCIGAGVAMGSWRVEVKTADLEAFLIARPLDLAGSE